MASAQGQETNQVSPAPLAMPTLSTNSAVTLLAPVDPREELLFEACKKGDLARVTELVAQGVSVDSRDKANGDMTPLIHAANSGKLEVVRYLLAKGAPVDAPMANGATALLCALAANQHPCIMELMAAGADVTLINKNGFFAMYYAGKNGDDEVASALIARHADVNTWTKQGSALGKAAELHRTSTLKLLLEAGAKPLPQEAKPQMGTLALVATREEPAVVDLFLAHGFDINEAGQDGVTPLMGAVCSGKAERVQHVLEKGGDPLLRDQGGKTALMFLAYLRGYEADRAVMIKLLLDHHAEIDAVDLKGDTALDMAASGGQTDMVELLKSRGAKVSEPHLPGWAAAGPRLPKPQAWALAVGAIYAQTNGGTPFILGYGGSGRSAEKSLSSPWGVTDHKSFMVAFEKVMNHGMRLGFQEKGKALAEMTDLGFETTYFLVRGQERVSLIASRESYRRWKEKSGLAWDLCRAANLIGLGYNAKYISESEAWGLLARVARQTQKSFTSWQEMSDNFLDGRKIWAGESSVKFELCAKLMLNPNDKNSPWTQSPWETDLMKAGE